MKKVIIALALAICAAPAVYAQAPQVQETKVTMDKNAPKFSFIGGDSYDYGTVNDQKDVEHVFKFKNVGKTPLIIANASGSCGCTVPEFDKQPVLPGKMGEVRVTFHTAGKSGPQDKSVYIQSNAPANVAGSERYELHIKGTVTPAAQEKAVAPAHG